MTSVAEFSDPTILRPTVTLDVAGTFIARVEFYDAADANATTPLASTTVTLSTENLAPVAQIAKRGLPGRDRPLILDGSQSYDVDGDAITYAWSVLNAPVGGTATFSDPVGIFTEVSLEGAGLFELALNVQDETGLASKAAIIKVERQTGSNDESFIQLSESLGLYNLIAEEFYGRQEVEGRSYIGQMIRRTNGQFGNNISDGESLSDLYVDGDIERGNINLRAGGIATISGVKIRSNVNNGILEENASNLPVFNFDDFKEQSAFLASLSGEGVDFSDQNNIQFGGAPNSVDAEAAFGPNTRVVQASLSDLRKGGYSIDLSGADTVIINVSGQAGRFEINPLGGTPSAERVIWNFFEAGSINVKAPIVGHVLAPYATMRGFSGSSEGTVIAHRVNLTNGELHQRSWLGQVPASPGGAVQAEQSVAPTASLTFDAVVAKANGSFVLDPFASTNVDGETIPVQAQIVSTPTGGIATALTDDLGYITVTTDVPGDYVVSLKAGGGDLATYDQVLVTNGGNVRPVARIDDIATARPVGETVVLNASSSYDLDGDLLNYRWSILSQPDGSSAQIDNNERVFPTITPDVDGLYVVQLIASDAQTHSVPVTQIINTQVILPRAIVSPDQVVDAAGAAPVTGSSSIGSDYIWSVLGFSNAGLTAALADQTQADTTLTLSAEADGSFGLSVAQLIAADSNGISLPSNVAVAGADLRPYATDAAQVVASGGVATVLDGASLALDPNGDALAFNWSLIAKPQNSNAAIDPVDPELQIVTAETLDFVPDVSGIYVLQASATDDRLTALPSTIVVVVENSAPVAVVEPLGTAFVGDIVGLDASGSFDPDGDALTFAWQVLSAPDGSTAFVQGATSPVANFVPDQVGNYQFGVISSDFELSSPQSTVSLTVENRAPVAVLMGPADVNVGDDAVISALGSSDPDGDSLTYELTLTAFPDGANATIVEITSGEFGFTPEAAGEYVFTLIVDDGEDTATTTFVLNAVAVNNAPVLGATLDVYTVELGLELALNLEGFDPDGDATLFYAQTLPLPDGVSLDTNSGSLRYRPETGQEGTYDIIVGVSDGALTDERTIQIEVVQGTSDDTSIFGFVYDRGDFEQGVETPLSGIPVRLDGLALETITDVDGQFQFGSLTGTQDLLIVDADAVGGPGGYVVETRAVRFTENQNRDVSPDILLTALNEGCITVVPGEATILSGLVTGVTLSIDADTIVDEDGDPFTGEVCLGSLPQQSTLDGFADGVNACQVFGLNAPGAVFTTGAQISAPNYDNLPDTAQLELWQRQTVGNFRRGAGAIVDPGAITVSSRAVRLTSGGLFTFLPQAPLSVASGDQPTGNRSLTVLEGDLSETYTMPGYFAFNREQNIGLAYHSTAADPTVIVAGDVTVSDTAGLPNILSTRINVGGLSQTSDATWTPRSSADGSRPALIGEAVTLRQSMPFDATGLNSGRYDYTFSSQAGYDCSTVVSEHDSEIYVQNETDSPYGAGWSVDGLQQLTIGDDGSVAIIDDESVITFDPKPTFTEFNSEPLVFPSLGSESIVAADLDGNSKLDFAFIEAGFGRVTAVYNFGDRDFRLFTGNEIATPEDIPETGLFFPKLISLQTADYNSDGFLDLSTILQDVPSFAPLLNSGNGRFIVGETIQNFANVHSVSDFDGDGLDDLLLLGGAFGFDGTNTGVLREQFYFGNGSGLDAFVQVSKIIPGEPTQVVASDIDGDGLLDRVYRHDEGVSVIFNTGRTSAVSVGGGFADSFGSAPIRRVGNYVAVGDLNGDGFEDFITSGPNKLELFLNIDGRTFLPAVEIARPVGADDAGQINLIDADADGTLDLLFSGLSDAAPGKLAIYRGKGDGTFDLPEFGLLDRSIGQAIVADVNGDGSLDLISTQRFSVTIDFSDPTASGEFIAGAGEFSELKRLDDGSWERRYKDGTKVLFDTEGRQTAEVDQYGNARNFIYDDNNRLLQVVDQVGGVTTFAYEDTLGRLTSVTFPDGRKSLYEYNDLAQLTGITKPDGAQMTYGYDEQGRLTQSEDERGNISTHTYAASGLYAGSSYPNASSIEQQASVDLGLEEFGTAPLPLSFVEPEDRITEHVDDKGGISSVEVNEFGAIIAKTDPIGRRSVLVRDADNLIVEITRPIDTATFDERTDQSIYDSRGNIIEVKMGVGTPLERSRRYEFEPEFNRVIREIDYDGFETLYEYNEFGDVIRMLDPEGGEEAYVYDDLGFLISQTDERGNTTSFLYGDDRNISLVTLPDGSANALFYDDRGNVVEFVQSVGTDVERTLLRTFDNEDRVLSMETLNEVGLSIDGKMFYEYDLAGNVVKSIDETGLETIYAYNSVNELISDQTPGYGLTTYTYNVAGELHTETDAEGHTSSNTYDIVGRLIQTVDKVGNVSNYEYTASDKPARVTDARGNQTLFEYDVLDRRISRTNPLNQVITLDYDARDNLTTLIRENGAVETATYDGLSRRVTVQTADNALAYAYDPVGNVVRAADDDSEVIITYDERDRVASIATNGAVGPQPGITLNYTYDERNQRRTMADSLGGLWGYQFDEKSRVTSIETPWGDTHAMDSDCAGRPTELTNLSGRQSVSGYDSDRLISLEHFQGGASISRSGFAYAPDGAVNLYRDLDDSAASETLAYDAANRLLQVAEGIPTEDGGAPIPTEDYAYDPLGNRTTSHLSDIYVVDDHNRLLEDTDYTYAYDVKGNRIERLHKTDGLVETYNYNAMNQLIEVTSSDGASAQYAYDAFGRRIAKTVAGATTSYVYDMGNSLEIMAHDRLLEFRNGSLEKRWLYGQEIDQPLAFESYQSDATPGAGTAYSLHADRQGSIIAVTDQTTGTLAARYRYDAFGQREVIFENVAQDVGFTGREYDAETDLYYYRARHYDPNIGRFLQSDPLGFGGRDMNLYAYTWNDPANWSDPSGLTATKGYIRKAGVALGMAASAANVLDAAACVGNRIASMLHSMANVEMTPAGGVYHVVQWAGCVGAVKLVKRTFPVFTKRLRRNCGCGGGGASSFVASTLVQTVTGPVRIAELREGDMVIARDEDGGVTGVYPVTAIMKRQTASVLHLTLENQSGETSDLGVTAEHPLFDFEAGWTQAGDLAVGDTILDRDELPLTVVAKRIDNTPQLVHNLEVEGAHTYFAGDLAVWAHNRKVNGNSDKCTKTAYLYRLFDGAGKFLKWGITNNVSRRTRQHRRAFGDPGVTSQVMQSGRRCDIRQMERFFEATDPGPENLTSWSGSGRF